MESDDDSHAQTGTVAISSDPAAADIHVDGQLVGQTPATLRLPSGLHYFQVKFSDQRKWERDLNVLKESKVSLRALPGDSR
jgi:hypothetical protein